MTARNEAERELARNLQEIRTKVQRLVAYVDSVETRLLAMCVAAIANGADVDKTVIESLELLARKGESQHTRDAARATLQSIESRGQS